MTTHYNILPDAVDQSVVIRIIDSGDGTPETAVEHNTAGIALWYRRTGATQTPITEVALAALDSAHSDGGIEHMGDGYYRLDLPDAAVAASAAECVVGGTVTGMIVVGARIQLSNVPGDVRAWLGTAPATPTTAGVPEVDVTHWLGTAAATPTVAGVPEVDVTHFGGTAGTFAAGIPETALTTSGIAAVADGLLDESLAGHLSAGSVGAVLQPMHSAACQAGGDGTHVVLAASAKDVDDYYIGDKVVGWVTATGANKFSDYITDYVGATRTATVTGIPVSPDATYSYVVWPGGSIPGASAPTAGEVADAFMDEPISEHTTEGTVGAYLGAVHLHAGTAQAGGAASITFDATGSSTTVDFYKYDVVSIRAGTGAGQTRQISAYSAGRVATVAPAWTTPPDNTSEYVVIPLGIDASTPASVATAVWAATRAGNAGAGTFGEYVNADVVRLSGDATAADNAEAFFDGTGYAGTGNVIPSVTTVGSVTGAVGSVTGNVGGNLLGSAASVAGNVDGDVTGNVGGNLVGTIGGLAAQAKTDVNAEVLDVIGTDTFAEPAGVPAATATIKDMLHWNYTLARNKLLQTANTTTIRNDADNADIATSTVSDDGTTGTATEWV